MSKLEKNIKEVLSAFPEGLRRKKLMDHVRPESTREFHQVLGEMLDKKILLQLESGRIVLQAEQTAGGGADKEALLSALLEQMKSLNQNMAQILALLQAPAPAEKPGESPEAAEEETESCVTQSVEASTEDTDEEEIPQKKFTCNVPYDEIGVFHKNVKGFGFVEFPGESEDAFIPQSAVNGALTGDTVAVRYTESAPGLGASGIVVQILKRAREKCVGVLAVYRGKPGIRPMRRDLPDFIPFSTAADAAIAEENCNPGDWLEAKLVPVGKNLAAAVPQRVANGGDVAATLNAIAREYGIPSKYTPEQESAAHALEPVSLKREDCRNLLIFTCDPMDARDYDDAISLQPGQTEDTVVLGVHIADVACFVPPKSKLDAVARQRGFTCYLPGRTVGMLPDALANDLCSLKQGVDRFAHSVFITVSRTTGQVLSSRRCHTLIRSSFRLCYEQVDRILQGESLEEIPDNLRDTLVSLNELTEKMRLWRQQNDRYLPMEIPEVRVLCSGNPPAFVGLSTGSHSRSGEIIEECMLAANVEVACEMKSRQIHGLFRNHDEPEADRLEEFTKMASIVFSAKKLNLAKRDKMVQFLKNLGEKPCGTVVAMSLLRMLPRAAYSADCLGHYGLGKRIYCHFTSPIRRYPDLLVHQQLIIADTAGEGALSKKAAEKLALDCNDLEINVDQACFAASDRLKIGALSAQADENAQNPREDAIVCKITPGGAMIYLTHWGLMGFVETRNLGGKKWSITDHGLALSSGEDKVRYGDQMQVEVTGIDPVRAELVYKRIKGRKGRR